MDDSSQSDSSIGTINDDFQEEFEQENSIDQLSNAMTEIQNENQSPNSFNPNTLSCSETIEKNINVIIAAASSWVAAEKFKPKGFYSFVHSFF